MSIAWKEKKVRLRIVPREVQTCLDSQQPLKRSTGLHGSIELKNIFSDKQNYNCLFVSIPSIKCQAILKPVALQWGRQLIVEQSIFLVFEESLKAESPLACSPVWEVPLSLKSALEFDISAESIKWKSMSRKIQRKDYLFHTKHFDYWTPDIIYVWQCLKPPKANKVMNVFNIDANTTTSIQTYYDKELLIVLISKRKEEKLYGSEVSCLIFQWSSFQMKMKQLYGERLTITVCSRGSQMSWHFPSVCKNQASKVPLILKGSQQKT